MIEFAAETFQNEYLPVGGSKVDAVVTVTASGGGPALSAPGTAVVIIVDVSGSMGDRHKLGSAKKAAEAAINRLRDGVLFGVVAGAEIGRFVFPATEWLVAASSETRRDAVAAISTLRAGGGTAIGRWLTAAHHRLRPYEQAIRHVVLLTDGQDESETPEELRAALDTCEGVFQCDCRGVGTDWRVDELREISSRLLGTVDIVARPEDLAADFDAMAQRAMGKRAADVRLRLWTPRGSAVRFTKQVLPTIEDLTARAVGIDDRTVEYATGAWGDETRDYHVQITVPPQSVGAEMLAGRVSLVVDGRAVSQSLVKAIWTDDVATSTQINARVAHATGQAELAAMIAEGLDARKRGDESFATMRLGRAVQLAAASGHDDTLRLLARVVDIVDADTGTVRSRRRVDLADEMALDTRSTKTIRTKLGE